MMESLFGALMTGRESGESPTDVDRLLEEVLFMIILIG